VRDIRKIRLPRALGLRRVRAMEFARRPPARGIKAIILPLKNKRGVAKIFPAACFSKKNK
jgi:hypothetical protein